MTVSRRTFLATAAAATLATSPRVRAAPSKSANVLFVFSDEHNPKIASIHGHRLVQTPNLDRMAREGTVFEATYCPSPLCMPCRSAFMSGRRVHEIQCYSNCNATLFDYPTYGAVLDEQGVHSVHIGKTDAFRPGADLGFSEMLVPGDRERPGDLNGRRRPLAIRSDGAERASGYGARKSPFGGDDRKVEKALAWLNETAPTLDVPWTCAVNLVKPHFPHFVDPDRWERYAAGADLPAFGMEAASAQHPYAQDLRKHFQTEGFSEADIRGLRRGYLGCVDYIDAQLGLLLDALEANGLRENTVVIYSSDHGDMLGKFGMWWKCSLFEDSARVPLVVSGPGFEAGKRVTTPVDLLDVQATFFAATGTERPKEWAGQPLQTIGADDTERFVFSEYHGHGTRAGAYLIRQGDWKLIYNCEAPHQLFHLGEDPEELVNRYGDAPDVAKRLEEALRSVCDPEAENARAFAFEEKQLAEAGA